MYKHLKQKQVKTNKEVEKFTFVLVDTLFSPPLQLLAIVV